MMDNTINGRTPEEIKQWLNCEISQYNHSCEEYYTCYACPNFDLQMDDNSDVPEATLAYIQQLERERDAAVDALRKCNRCPDCVHYYEPLALKIDACGKCFCGSNWQWRGVEVEQ